MSPSAIYSKSGKGVQEASGKTSLLSRADRAVLSAIDGKMTLEEVADKIGKPFDARFEELIGKLDRDGFVRQVSAGAPPPAAKPGAAAKPAAAAAPAKAPGEDLDFTVIMPAPKAAPPKPAVPPPAPPVAPHMAQSQAAAFAKAREEAEEKAARERDRIKAETEAKLRAETEAKMRSEAEAKAKADAEAKVRAEAEAKVKAAREAAVRAAAEAKAKAEAEAAAKLEAERARVREAEEKARREAEEAKRQAEEAKRKAEEEARRAREEAERIRREAEEAKRQAEEARRKAEEEARRIREEAERKAREEAERRRKEEEARRAREEQERKEREARAREEEARRQKEREERETREAKEREERQAREREEEARRQAERDEREAQARRAAEKAEREAREQEEMERQAREIREKAARKEQEKAAAKPASFGDSLLADLDSFSQRDDQERKEKEEAARKEKEGARRRQEEAEREAKERAERDEKEKQRAEDERRRKEEEARRREEDERREAERREREAKEKEEEERRRKRRAKDDARPASGDDIPLSDDDLDMDEVRKDEAILSKESRRAAREREERERQAKKDAKREAKEDKEEKRAQRREEPAPPPQFRRPRKWGKTVATFLFIALLVGVGVIHVMPISTAEYEAAATQALGRPVRIPSGRISLYSGVQLKFDNVSVGEAKIGAVRAYPEIGSLFGEKKAFSRIELERVTIPMAAIGELFGAKVRGDAFSVGRVGAKQVALAGPLKLPPLEVDLAIAPDGAVSSTSLRGPEGLSGKLTPRSASEMEFDVVAHSFTVPVVPDMSLSGFAMKGIATRDGMRIESWGGSSLDGGVSGSANVRWTAGNWTMDGVMTVRGINAAVFAPALLSEGKAEGTGRFSFNDADPMSFLTKGRIEGTYSVHKGVLGSFDLSRAITTGGRQVGGRTPFTGLSGQGVFDKGAVALRNVSFGAGALNAGASADISPEGNLSGRIVADVRTPSQTLRATLNLGGTVKDPQVKN